jgi:hypothetical protein
MIFFSCGTVIGKILADKNFRDNNICGTKIPSYGDYKGIFAPQILFPPIYFSANILNFTVIYLPADSRMIFFFSCGNLP